MNIVLVNCHVLFGLDECRPLEQEAFLTVSKTPCSGQAGPLSLPGKVRKSSKQIRMLKMFPWGQLEDKLSQNKVTIDYNIKMSTVGTANRSGPSAQHLLLGTQAACLSFPSQFLLGDCKHLIWRCYLSAGICFFQLEASPRGTFCSAQDPPVWTPADSLNGASVVNFCWKVVSPQSDDVTLYFLSQYGYSSGLWWLLWASVLMMFYCLSAAPLYLWLDI